MLGVIYCRGTSRVGSMDGRPRWFACSALLRPFPAHLPKITFAHDHALIQRLPMHGHAHMTQMAMRSTLMQGYIRIGMSGDGPGTCGMYKWGGWYPTTRFARTLSECHA